MVELALASSLTHPDAFGAAWIILALLCGWRVAARRFGSNANGQAQQPDSSIINPQPVAPGAETSSHFSLVSASALQIWLLAFGPFLALSLISVLVHHLSLSRAEVLEVIIGGALLAAGLPLIRIRPTNIGWAAVAASMGALGVVFYSLVVTQYHRAGMTFHPINYGMGCGMVLIMLMVWWKFRDQIFQGGPTIALGAGLAAALISLMASGSRGPILSFVICMVVASLYWAKQSRRPMWISMIGLSLLSLAAAVIFYQRVDLELRGGDVTSHGVRWQLIQLTLEQIQKTPFLGIGADQAGKFFAQFPEPIRGLNHAHVTILNAALELGVLGAAAWAWAFGTLAWFFWQQRAHAAAAFWQAGLLLTLFIFLCSMTQDIMSHTYTRRLLTFGLVLFVVMCKANSKDPTWPTPPSAQS